MEWQENQMNITEDLSRKARLAEAKAKKIKFWNKRIVEDLITGIVGEIIPFSVAGNLIGEILDDCVWTGRVNIIVKELEACKDLRTEVCRRLEESNALLKSLEDEENRARRLEKQKVAQNIWKLSNNVKSICDGLSGMSLCVVDKKEHDSIDKMIRDMDVEMVGPMYEEYEMETEVAHDELDEMILNMESWQYVDADEVVHDGNDEAMKDSDDNQEAEKIMNKFENEAMDYNEHDCEQQDFEEWMETELSEMGFITLSKSELTSMCGDNNCNVNGYSDGGTWWLSNWLANKSTICGGRGKNNNVYGLCTNKMGCACLNINSGLGPLNKIQNVMMGSFSCVDGINNKRKRLARPTWCTRPYPTRSITTSSTRTPSRVLIRGRRRLPDKTDHEHGAGGQELETQSRLSTSTTTPAMSPSRRPSDWKLARRRGVVPDGLVQSKLAAFVMKFPNLQTVQGARGEKRKCGSLTESEKSIS